MLFHVFFFTVSLVTVLQDESKLSSCPVASLTDTTIGNDMIIVMDRSAELALMDHDIGTCLLAFNQGHRFLRLVAYIYVPSTVNSIRIQLNIPMLPCTDPGMVLYHQVSSGEHDGIQFRECTLIKQSAGHNVGLDCWFVCHNISHEKSPVRAFVQIEKWSQRDDIPINICNINVDQYFTWTAFRLYRR